MTFIKSAESLDVYLKDDESVCLCRSRSRSRECEKPAAVPQERGTSDVSERGEHAADEDTHGAGAEERQIQVQQQ